MKLKTKLLSIIAPAAVLTTVAPIALTSCGGDSGSQTNKVTYSGETTLTITSAGKTLEFTLSKALGTGETLTVEYSSLVGDFPSTTITKIDGTKVTVLLYLLSSGSSHSKFNLVFKCFNSSSTVTPVWSSEITGFDVTKTA